MKDKDEHLSSVRFLQMDKGTNGHSNAGACQIETRTWFTEETSKIDWDEKGGYII